MEHQKFLRFNETNIVFISVDGVYHIALKPICEALKIDVRRSREIAKNDAILGPVVSEQALQVSKNGKKQLRNMTCIPEQYIYGWLFSLRSDSKELIAYKKTCYDLLFNHFHGTITNRKDILLDISANAEKIYKLEESLKEDDRKKELDSLKSENKKLGGQLKVLDQQIIQQPELFSDN